MTSQHPGYLSYLLWLAGIGLALSSLAAWILIVGVAVFLIWRIRTEETMLLAEFGHQYREYMRRTKRLLPLLW